MPYSRYLIGHLPCYSVLVCAGILSAVLWCMHEEKRRGLKPDTIVDLALWVVPCGIIGARLYFILFSFDSYRNNLLDILKIWEGGLAIYGGILAGGAAAIAFAYRRKLHPLLLTDIIVPGLALAQAIGRWGNFFNMEAYGSAVENAALCFFPLAVAIPEGSTVVWHYATFFYESMWNLLVFALLALNTKKLPRGLTTVGYFLLYGAGRFTIEQLRTDSLMLLGLRVSQWLSLLLLTAALVVLLVRCVSKGKKIQAALAASLVALGIGALLCRFGFLSQLCFSVCVAAGGLCCLLSLKEE